MVEHLSEPTKCWEVPGPASPCKSKEKCAQFLSCVDSRVGKPWVDDLAQDNDQSTLLINDSPEPTFLRDVVLTKS